MSELSFGEVGEILHLLQEVEAEEIDLQWGDLRIQVRKHGATADAVAAPAPPAATSSLTPPEKPQPQPPTVAASPAPVSPAAQAEPTVAEDDVSPDWVAISAPMAGTFYRSPSPEAPVFAEVGDVVAAGDTVALIEVMKLFTELKAQAAGKVSRIDAADGSMVEFDQPLVWIEPA